MKVYVIIAIVDYNDFNSIEAIFYNEEQALEYMKNSKDKPYYMDWQLVESEITPVTNIL